MKLYIFLNQGNPVVQKIRKWCTIFCPLSSAKQDAIKSLHCNKNLLKEKRKNLNISANCLLSSLKKWTAFQLIGQWEYYYHYYNCYYMHSVFVVYVLHHCLAQVIKCSMDCNLLHITWHKLSLHGRRALSNIGPTPTKNDSSLPDPVSNLTAMKPFSTFVENISRVHGVVHVCFVYGFSGNFLTDLILVLNFYNKW